MFLILGEGLSKSGGLTPFLGSWLPNIFFSAIAAVFVYREGEKAGDNPFVIVAEKGLMSSDPDEGLIKLTMKT